ncbi:class I SAM-dependent methyltransferase [Candidatus Accumulibacter phosphatis]|uniref:Class I SAM-dependent methyltransferase n=1 Tax=Candidatus Accumulibacter phosphatis TaxID=327160 RepID=A0ABX1TVF4_9PROT|nr:class I SAM-dependent methyltransferase [Candidatus Accumulibacter phosphatis]NMQ26764.1 class I SAM-dependent methyltransferase [Candidatus Accumulibacter phosphatis]
MMGVFLISGVRTGFLLKALGGGYEISGIEVNESSAERARVGGGLGLLEMIFFERDLFPKYAGYFDAITAIAVFEHVTDFRKAIEVSLQMLKPDGVLIF